MAELSRDPLAVHRLRELQLAPGEHPQGQTHLSAASGLVRIGERLFVVADDELHLAVFDLGSPAPLRLHRLRQGDLPAGAECKARKPDFEVLLHLPPVFVGGHGALLALGSGSGPKRQTAMLLALDMAGEPAGLALEVPLEPVYRPLRERFAELNIEGGFVDDEHLVLLQRGNRSGTPNASLRYAMKDIQAWLRGETSPLVTAAPLQTFELGTVAGVALAFTDGAALSGGRWVFSAVAEDSADSWADGDCLGAVVGVVDATGRIETLRHLAPTLKVEGLTAQEHAGTIELLMVTDADDAATPAWLLSARLDG